MAGITPRPLGQQVKAGQLAEQLVGLLRRNPGQAGRRGGRDIGTRVHAEQPEHPRGRLAKQLVGPGDHGPYATERIAAFQGIERSLRVPQLARQLGEREIGANGGARGGDGQGQRQPRARLNQRGGRLLLLGDPLRADEFGQQLLRIPLGQHVKWQRTGAFSGDQASQLAAAGDHDHAVRAAWQQLTDLLRIAGVVQQHQHVAVGQDAAVQGDLAVQAGRDSGGRYFKGVEEAANGIGRPGRSAARVEAAQVDIELAVGESAGGLMRPICGQCGLTGSRGSGDHTDHGGPARGAELAEQVIQGRQFIGPAGEMPDGRW